MIVSHFALRFEVPAPPEPELIEYARTIFQHYDDLAGQTLRLNDYGVYVAVEEGSVKSGGKITTAAKNLAVGVVFVGGFAEGVNWLYKGSLFLSDKMVAIASDHRAVNHRPPVYVRRDAGAIGKLERLMRKVRNGEISPEEGSRIATEILTNGTDTIPASLIEEIRQTLHAIHGQPEQLVIPVELPPPQPVPVRPKFPREVPLPERHGLRVVIEREHKSDKPKIDTRHW